jgi:transposase
VEADGSPVARSAGRVRSVADRVQSVRSLVEAREVEAAGWRTAGGRSGRLVQPRRDDQPSAPARSWRKRGGSGEAIGRSRGGPSTKVHLIVDSVGRPIDFELSEGQRHESIAAIPLVYRVRPRCLIADRAFDTDPFRELLFERNCMPVIPPHPNRNRPWPFDKELYKERNVVERAFSVLKQARRFATRYEKTLRNYASVVAIGCALFWLRG